MSTVEQIDIALKWLSDNTKSQNIVQLSQCLNKLSTLAVTVGEDLSDAYTVMNELEDDYDEAVAAQFDDLTANMSATAAKPLAEAACIGKRRAYTRAKNIYKRLSVYQERVDRVIDSFKQYVSTLKDERKYSGGQV